MKEIWKDVPGYEGLYQVSNLGRVKSLSRYVNGRKPLVKPLKERILKFWNNRGYLCVRLCPNPKVRKCIGIHRLVAFAFIPNPNDYPEIDHIDGNPSNNNVENLRWVTHRQNELNPITRERISNSRIGEKNPIYGKRGKEIHNAKAVVRIDQNGEEKYYDSIADAARDNNIRQSGISGCLCGKNKTSGGYVWRYA